MILGIGPWLESPSPACQLQADRTKVRLYIVVPNQRTNHDHLDHFSRHFSHRSHFCLDKFNLTSLVSGQSIHLSTKEGQADPTVVVSWSTADSVPILDPGRFNTFWVEPWKLEILMTNCG